MTKPTDRQLEILRWLQKGHPHGAVLFESALSIFSTPGIPCKSRLIAHVFRELCSELANAGGQSSHLQWKPLLDTLTDQITRAGLVLSISALTGDDPRPKTEQSLTIPFSVRNALENLVSAWAAEPRGEIRAQQLLDHLHSRHTTQRGHITPTAKRWHLMNDRFVKCCHDRTTSDSELFANLLPLEIAFLEETLSAVAASAIDNLTILDNILAEANA